MLWSRGHALSSPTISGATRGILSPSRRVPLRFHSSLAEPDIGKTLETLRTRDIPAICSQLTDGHQELYDATLRGCLPPRELAPQHSSKPLRKRRHSLSFLSTQFNHSVGTDRLLSDGTDMLHSPGLPWNLRVWAGGRIQTHDHIWKNGDKWVMGEKIKHVEVKGQPPNDKLYVTVARTLVTHLIGTTGAVHKQVGHDGKAMRVLMSEERVLCFMREPNEPYQSILPQSRIIPPPTGAPDLFHTLTPTPSLLARFSALTFNAHAIHLDPNYARNVYGLPNIVVHGPLTVVLMLEVLKRALNRYHREHNLPDHEPVDIEYKNYLPLFVNEKMTICCRRSEPAEPPPEQATWLVWIEKQTSEGTTMAVRGKVKTLEVKLNATAATQDVKHFRDIEGGTG